MIIKIKTCVRLQRLSYVIIWFVALPFLICGIFLGCLTKPFAWVGEELDALRWKIGNKLLRSCDKVKDGTIKNREFIKTQTVWVAYEKLKEEGLI